MTNLNEVELERLLLSIPEAASALAISRTKFYELISAGLIRPVRIGRCVRVAKAEIVRFIDVLSDER